MNTKNLKSYAPKARKQFIEAVKKRAAHFGIYEDRIAEVRIEGGAAIIEGRAFTRKEGEQRKRLESKLAERGYDMFTREIAYTWFNRLAALRYMEIHDYFDHGFRVLSPAKSHLSNADSLPEILNHASDVAESLNLDKNHIIELQLAGDKEEQLYRELLLGQCHQLANIMPFVFKGLTADSIDDAAELLLPDNLTKTDSILKGLITDIPEEDWNDIEVIGWLYQFYISEHKDAVIGKVVKSEDIPAATQLFTPNWIVKYLVQNSLGRQWLATYPESELKSKMEYYIEPAKQSDEVIEQLKAITPTSIDPEEIKVLDPACGSGHILVEVYEVLREIYLERGYRLREIPELILTKNIYGLDIDDRAAQLASFALMMKAREDDRRIFQRVEDGEVTLNVYSLQSTEHLDIPKIWKALDLEGNQQTGSTGGLFDTSDEFVKPTGVYKEDYELLQMLKSAFLLAKTLGSLIKIEHQHLENLASLKKLLEEKRQGTDPAASSASSELLPIVNQALILAQQYESIVANPPFIGTKGMNNTLKEYGKRNFPDSKQDLYSIFIERSFELTKSGKLGFVSPYTWMFITTFEKFRKSMLNQASISSLVKPSYTAFFDSAIVPLVTFVIDKGLYGFRGKFTDLGYLGRGDEQPERLKSALNDSSEIKLYEFNNNNFKKLPSWPIAFWLSNQMLEMFENNPSIKAYGATPATGLQTGDNGKFIRNWFEVSNSKVNTKWYKLNDGGNARKWYGNLLSVINWENDGELIKAHKSSVIRNPKHYFKEGITWNRISSSFFSFRYLPEGFIFDQAGDSMFFDDPKDLTIMIGFLNSSIGFELMKILCPTLNATAGSLEQFPVPKISEASVIQYIQQRVDKLIALAKNDWDTSELSMDFISNPLVLDNHSGSISISLQNFIENCNKYTNLASLYEEELNQCFIELLGFEGEISPKVERKAITLFGNVDSRYSKDSELSSKDRMFKSDILTELLSFYIGSALGRFSVNCEGIVYANAGNLGFKGLEAEGAYKTFPADDDGIIPLASEEWLFDDDATARFKEFVKTVWGEDHLTENLEFVAESLCLHALKSKKGEGAMDTVRRYFSTQFFKDHCKTYKKRPIYWLFSSGKEKAFECLVYLHRYNEGTLSRMRTEYVTPLMGKFDAQHTLLSEQQIQASGTEARRIEKELKTLDKKQAELRTFDEQLKHYAEKRITLDLDDGVKENYGKFGNLLADVKDIHGKAVK